MDDLLLIGGGLANCLLAWRLAELRPEIRWRLIEQEDHLGGNHTWSFHDSDLSAEARRWLAPLIACRWSEHEVAFPGYRRRMAGGYQSVTSERLHESMMAHRGGRILLNAPVAELGEHGAGEWKAACVLDGRGYLPSPHMKLAYQKFLGWELETAQPHGQSLPLLMDATVEQKDGYRFLYVLPFSPTRLLIEDTRYSARPEIDLPAIRQDLAAYAARRGWRMAATLREESGVLPVTLDGDFEAFWREPARVLPTIGLRAGLCHATTGYALPDAVRLIERIVRLPSLDNENLRRAVCRYAREQWRRGRFYRLLNRMLFLAAEPAQRYRIMERFYRLPEPLIARFYAGETVLADRCRILAGKPPVPLGAAWRSLAPSSAWREAA